MKCVQQQTYIITSNLIQKFHPLVNCIQKIRLKTVQGFKGQPDSFCGGIARKIPEIIYCIGSLPFPFFLWSHPCLTGCRIHRSRHIGWAENRCHINQRPDILHSLVPVTGIIWADIPLRAKGSAYVNLYTCHISFLLHIGRVKWRGILHTYLIDVKSQLLGML